MKNNLINTTRCLHTKSSLGISQNSVKIINFKFTNKNHLLYYHDVKILLTYITKLEFPGNVQIMR